MKWRGRCRWVLFLLGWTLLSLMFVPEVYLYFLYRAEAIPWIYAVAMALANAGIAFVFLPPIVWLARRYPVDRQTWRRALAIHIPACFVFAMSHSGLYAALCYASPSLFHALFVRFHPNLLTYWAIVGFTQALDYFDRYRERERQLAQAELLLMKSQLHPHFLFNTLHTVSAMMHEDVAAADRMINRLASLLRIVLDTPGMHEVTLQRELEFIGNYIAIEQTRFPDRLVLRLHIDPDVLDALVPNMLLQPLVENSLRHGLRLHDTTGTIEISAARNHGTLQVTVADSGRGVDPDAGRLEGIGLTNTRVRLRELYGPAHSLSFENNFPHGVRVVITLPFRPAAIESSASREVQPHDNPRVDRGRRAVGAEAPFVPVHGRTGL